MTGGGARTDSWRKDKLKYWGKENSAISPRRALRAKKTTTERRNGGLGVAEREKWHVAKRHRRDFNKKATRVSDMAKKGEKKC